MKNTKRSVRSKMTINGEKFTERWEEGVPYAELKIVPDFRVTNKDIGISGLCFGHREDAR